jgi:hypothetical protein
MKEKPGRDGDWDERGVLEWDVEPDQLAATGLPGVQRLT